MLWVMLDQTAPAGPHGFMDSTANGPWATALVDEFIPWLERQYRVDAKPPGRLLYGSGSGGRTALWLLAKQPKLFGRAWMDSPDTFDFRSFLGTDIYAQSANLFHGAAGEPKLLTETEIDRDKVDYKVQEVAGLENVYGGTAPLVPGITVG
jgi:enterochelin esterase-like enzyme